MLKVMLAAQNCVKSVTNIGDCVLRQRIERKKIESAAFFRFRVDDVSLPFFGQKEKIYRLTVRIQPVHDKLHCQRVSGNIDADFLSDFTAQTFGGGFSAVKMAGHQPILPVCITCVLP